MLTFDSLLTAPGIASAAAAIVTLVQVIKSGIPWVDDHISGASLAFVLSAILYASAALVAPAPTPDLYLSVIAAWILAASAAMGIKAGADHLTDVRASRSTPADTTPAPVPPPDPSIGSPAAGTTTP